MSTEFKEPKTRVEALRNWTQFGVNDELAESLVANNFRKPTIVQG